MAVPPSDEEVIEAVRTIRELAIKWEAQETLNDKQEQFNANISKQVQEIREKDIHRDGLIEAVKKDTQDIKNMLDARAKSAIEWFKALTPWLLGLGSFLWLMLIKAGVAT